MRGSGHAEGICVPYLDNAVALEVTTKTFLLLKMLTVASATMPRQFVHFFNRSSGFLGTPDDLEVANQTILHNHMAHSMGWVSQFIHKIGKRLGGLYSPKPGPDQGRRCRDENVCITYDLV